MKLVKRLTIERYVLMQRWGPQNKNGGGSQTEQQDPDRIDLWKKAVDHLRIEEMTDSKQMCQGHSTLSSQRVFEGAQLTQLVQLVTAGRLFLGHKG